MLYPKNTEIKAPSPEWFTIGNTYCGLVRGLMASGMFRNVLEIGSAQGYSTHCFASAMKEGGFDFTACDVSFSDPVRTLANRFQFKLEQKRSKEVISHDYDFIFVDGNHDITTVGEEVSMLLDCGTDTILAHDTFLKGPDFEGCVLLRKVFSSHRDYFRINYCGRLEGDHTHYGMSLFTRRKNVYEFALNLCTHIIHDHG